MAVPNFQTPPYEDSNPGFTDRSGGFADANTRPPTVAPTSGGNQAPNLHVNAQARMPFTPNNGNPNGAHNNPQVPRVRRTRFGGGYIGAQPEGSVLGRGGVAFGQGALTPEQVAQNEQRTQAFNTQQQQSNLMQQFRQALLQNPTGMPFRQQQPMPTSFKPGMGQPPQGGGLPLSLGLPNLQGPAQSPFNSGMGPQAPWANDSRAPTQQELIQMQQNNDPRFQHYAQQGFPQPSFQPPQQQPLYRGGQDPRLGRYRPPQLVNGAWQDNGGYSYNLPNPFGPYPMFGQGPYGYGPGGG